MCEGGVGNIDVQGRKVLEDQGPRKYAEIWFERKLKTEGGDVLRTFQNCSNGVERRQATGLVEHFNDIDALSNIYVVLGHTMKVFDVLDGLQPC
jgi:hypothetical protein